MYCVAINLVVTFLKQRNGWGKSCSTIEDTSIYYRLNFFIIIKKLPPPPIIL